eukprot:gene846-biopygen15224
MIRAGLGSSLAFQRLSREPLTAVLTAGSGARPCQPPLLCHPAPPTPARLCILGVVEHLRRHVPLRALDRVEDGLVLGGRLHLPLQQALRSVGVRPPSRRGELYRDRVLVDHLARALNHYVERAGACVRTLG